MIISFPIDNFSQVKDIFADIFEIEALSCDNYLNICLDGVNFRFYKNKEKKTNSKNPLTIQVTNSELAWAEIVRRLELYCYRYQTNLTDLKFEINQAQQLLIWDIGIGVRLECYLH